MFIVSVAFMLTAQSLTMICMSLERTQRVRFPLMRVTKISAITKIGVIWSLALLSELPRGIFYQYDPNMKSLMKCYNVRYAELWELVCKIWNRTEGSRRLLIDFTWLQTKQIFGTWVPFAIYVTSSYLLIFLLPSLWLARGKKICTIDGDSDGVTIARLELVWILCLVFV